VAEYPEGYVELWAEGAPLPYTTYDRFPEVDQRAIVDNKRQGLALASTAEGQERTAHSPLTGHSNVVSPPSNGPSQSRHR
jgi:hypothetical protein